MVRITGQRRPDRGTIGRSGANRDYRMSTYGGHPTTPIHNPRLRGPQNIDPRLVAFFRAGFACIATRHAFRNIREFLAFFFAIQADLPHHPSEMRGVGGIDGGKALKRAASRDQLVGGRGAARHARIPHRQHAETVSEAILAGLDAMASGFLHSFEPRRMHRFDTQLGESLRRCDHRDRDCGSGNGEKVVRLHDTLPFSDIIGARAMVFH